jgi:acyl-CoA thioester hydrolase
MIVHKWPIRVYWEDTDAGGIVYHSVYLNFAERARTELVRELGVSQQNLADCGKGYAFAVARLEIDFKKPAKLDDLLEVVTSVVEVGGASARFDQRIFRTQDGQELAALNVRVGFIALDDGRPSRIPTDLKQRLNAKLNSTNER